MSKDFWGGMFDFNRDGKTTWDEEMLGLSLLEEDRKRTEKILSEMPEKPRSRSTLRSLPSIIPVPEVVDDSNYDRLRREYITECVCAVLALIVMFIPAILVLWAVFSAYDPKNSAAGFITLCFTVAGFVYAGVVIHTTGKSISTSLENLKLVKERYAENQKLQKEEL